MRTDRSPKDDTGRRISGGSQQLSPDRPSLVGSPRSHPSPTPPLPPASSFDFGRHSPIAASPTTAAPNSGYYGAPPSATNPELYAQRHSSYPPIPEINQWPAAQRPRTPIDPAFDSPTKPAMGVYPEPLGEAPLYPGLSQQRPLPTNFPPPMPGQQLPPIDPQMAPTWQHHHYFPPNTQAPQYVPSQERYICSTCNKAFSRPSSLKIHIYSHTGEKPYKCKYAGCEKTFSVRSNMKRHEKGCHGDSSSAHGNSPQTT